MADESSKFVDPSKRPEWVDSTLSALAKALSFAPLPTSAKVLAESIAENKSPITANNFSEKELALLRDIVKLKDSQPVNPNNPRGQINYLDYAPGKGYEFGLHNALTPAGNLGSTLGHASYKKGADNHTRVVDTYDFNPRSAYYAKDAPVLEKMYEELRAFAQRKIPEGKGRKVEIDLGDLSKLSKPPNAKK